MQSSGTKSLFRAENTPFYQTNKSFKHLIINALNTIKNTPQKPFKILSNGSVLPRHNL